MANFSALFTPGRIGPLTVKNRLVMPPMVRNYADENGCATPRYIAHIERIARGGVGTMILEASYVSQEGKGFARELGLHDDRILPGLQQLVAVAHRHGAAIGSQLYHAGLQTSRPVSGMQPVTASPPAAPGTPDSPRALQTDEIRQVTGAFARAARRAQQAGCDFVEIHAAHGYLVNQFLSPHYNHRQDTYGGSFENRMRFLLEVITAVRASVGTEFPIIVRLSGDEFLPDGLHIGDTIEIAQLLEKTGVHALHISAGNPDSYNTGRLIPPMVMPDGVNLPLASAVKHAVQIPVIAVGKLRYPQEAAAVLQNGDADFVAIGRTLLADPDWPAKVQSGRLAEINHCIACNQGCITRLFDQQDVWCTVNPACGREAEFAQAPGASKKVLVAGGGAAGMAAAKVAAERGHQVILFEKNDRLGGQLTLAAATPHRDGWRELRDYLVEEMQRLPIAVRLDTALTPGRVEQEAPDAVIIATGSYQTRPQLPIASRAHAVTARDLLEGHAAATGRVVVVGGGCAGAQTAELLAQQGHPVTLVEASEEIAVEAPQDDRALLLGRLNQLGVNLLTGHKVLDVDESGVAVAGSLGNGHLPADTVIFCLGSHPDTVLADLIGGSVPMTVVGDASRPRRVTDAMVEGALAALAL